MAALSLSLAAPLLQQREQHDDGRARARRLLLQRAAQQQRQHSAALRLAVRHHKATALQQRQQYVVRMARELDIARREGVRDVWKARNEAAQTQMIVEAMLLAFTFELVIAGQLPLALPPAVLAVYAALIGASLCAAVASIALLLVRHRRLALYDFARPRRRYRCGEAHPDLTGFYHCHCAALEAAGSALFRLSATASLGGCAVLAASKWWALFDGEAAAGALFAAPVALVLLGAWAGDLAVPGTTTSANVGDFGGLRSELADVEAFRAESGVQAAEDALSDAGTAEGGAAPSPAPSVSRPRPRPLPHSDDGHNDGDDGGRASPNDQDHSGGGDDNGVAESLRRRSPLSLGCVTAPESGGSSWSVASSAFLTPVSADRQRTDSDDVRAVALPAADDVDDVDVYS